MILAKNGVSVGGIEWVWDDFKEKQQRVGVSI